VYKPGVMLYNEFSKAKNKILKENLKMTTVEKSQLNEILRVERKDNKVFIVKKKGNYFKLIVKNEEGNLVEIKDFRYKVNLDSYILNY